MSEWEDARRTSAALDDGAGTLDNRFAGQGLVHAALSAEGPVRTQQPGLDVHARVMARIRAGGVGRSTPGLWLLAIAASLTLAAGSAWMVWRNAGIARPMSPPVARGERSPFTMMMDSLARSDEAVSTSMEEPFLREARLIREDTRQGMEIVLSRLPLGSGAFK